MFPIVCLRTKKNITKTKKIKYGVTKYGWWNLNIRVEIIIRWGNLGGEIVQSLGNKKK